jgi:peptidoglycan/LPS O-acetylase OafA/YrhL
MEPGHGARALREQTQRIEQEAKGPALEQRGREISGDGEERPSPLFADCPGKEGIGGVGLGSAGQGSSLTKLYWSPARVDRLSSVASVRELLKGVLRRSHLQDPAPPSRSQRLDVLRLVAVLLVLGNHMQPPPADCNSALRSAAEAWSRGGWVGVDLFFVLSGFLVSGLLFQEHQRRKTISAKNFLIRRGFKIYPGFWVLIAFTVIAALTFNPPPPHAPGLLVKTATELLFVQNYGAGLWNHTWSLAVEEHFYFSLAILLTLLARRRETEPFAGIPILFVTIAAVSLILRIKRAGALPYAHITHLCPSHLRMDSLFAGVLLSYVHHYRRSWLVRLARGRRALLLLAGCAAFLPAFLWARETTPFLYTFGFSLFYLGGGCVLIAMLGSEPPGPQRALAIPAYLGARSYSIYLWHMPVAIWLVPRILATLELFGLHAAWIVYLLIYVLVSLGFGVFMSILVEVPMLSVRERLFPSPRVALG